MSSAGREAVELAAMAGLDLDPWQQDVLEVALGERADGRWAAMEVGLLVPRQNGKGAILEARELAGLFLLGERFIVHSAHQFDTSLEAYRRLRFLIENTPEFDRRVKRYMNSHGEEGIELKGGQRIRFRTRTKGGGRGFSADCVVFDEAMELPDAFLAASFPIISARDNPQVWYTGSAVDKLIHDHGLVFARVRQRGHEGTDDALAWMEWSSEAPTPDEVTVEMASSLEVQATANPALGLRIDPDYVSRELGALGLRGFAVERLASGDWPSTEEGAGVFDFAKWNGLHDRDSQIASRLTFGFDVSPTRASATIAVAGLRTDELPHVEVIERAKGTGWIVARLAELVEKHRPDEVVTDERGPASSLLPDLEKAGVKVTTTNFSEYAQACGSFFDAYDQGRLRHLGQDELNQAVRGAQQRALGERWVWDPKASAADITPLKAATLAAWKVTAKVETPILVAFA